MKVNELQRAPQSTDMMPDLDVQPEMLIASLRVTGTPLHSPWTSGEFEDMSLRQIIFVPWILKIGETTFGRVNPGITPPTKMNTMYTS